LPLSLLFLKEQLKGIIIGPGRRTLPRAAHLFLPLALEALE